jgi:hypothetical protein
LFSRLKVKIKIPKKNLIIFKIIFFRFKVNSAIDICRQYTLGSLVFNSFYCIDFCCGTCNFRYCCSNQSLIILQEKCLNTLNSIEVLLSYSSTISKQIKEEKQQYNSTSTSNSHQKLSNFSYVFSKCY